MMEGYWLLVLHVLGDYVTQSDWMANEKTKRWWPALVHATLYTLPFALLMPRWEPLILIGATHLVIDHWRLARYLVWAKNLLAPSSWRFPWKDCQPTGYHKDKPLWLTLWLLFIADNLMHLAFNGLAWQLWGG